jgi:hypothetical protein
MEAFMTVKLQEFDVHPFDVQATITDSDGTFYRWPALADGKAVTVLVHEDALDELIGGPPASRSDAARDALLACRIQVEAAANEKWTPSDDAVKLFRSELGPID